jgi:uncharacterized protein (DUF362 family)
LYVNRRSWNDGLDRRNFLVRCCKAGLLAVATGLTGLWRHDAPGLQAQPETAAQVTLPDFSMPAVSPRMSIVTGADRRQTVRQAFKNLGGVETFIKPGDRVLLKVNAAFASSPLLGATTHPDLVEEVVRLCFEAGADRVAVTDNPINDPAACFQLTGIERAARTAGAHVILPKEQFFKPVTVPAGRLIREWPVLYQPLAGVNRLIGMAPVKDHRRSGASMSLKNWYGLLGGRRNIFHQDIHSIITELALMVKPTLVILDGTASMMTNGPTGGSLSDLRATHTMIVSTDAVAADAFGVTLLGKDVQALPHIARAAAAGAGTADYRKLASHYSSEG